MYLQDNEKYQFMTKLQNRPNPDEAFTNSNLPSPCSICGYVYDPAEYDGVSF